MERYDFLNEKIPPQIGLTIVIIIAIFAIGIFSINYGKTLEETILLEAYYPIITRKSTKLLPIKNIISTTAENEILHYQKISFWEDKDFLKFLRSKEEFGDKETQYFRDNLPKEERSKIDILNPKIAFNEDTKSINFSCDIKGTFSKNIYEFLWLFGNIKNFDLSNFTAKEKELEFQGKIDDVPTEISLKFPFSIEYSANYVWSK